MTKAEVIKKAKDRYTEKVAAITKKYELTPNMKALIMAWPFPEGNWKPTAVGLVKRGLMKSRGDAYAMTKQGYAAARIFKSLRGSIRQAVRTAEVLGEIESINSFLVWEDGNIQPATKKQVLKKAVSDDEVQAIQELSVGVPLQLRNVVAVKVPGVGSYQTLLRSYFERVMNGANSAQENP